MKLAATEGHPASDRQQSIGQPIQRAWGEGLEGLRMALIFPQLSGQQEAQAVLETEQAAAAADPAAGDALFVVSNK